MKVIYSFRMPVNSYVGGIASILNQYKQREKEFAKQGISIDFFDYHDACADKLIKYKIGHFIQLYKEKKALLRKIREIDEPVILHVHSSRKWQLLKDLLLLRYVRRKVKCEVCLSIHFAEVEKILYGSRGVRSFELSIIRNYVDRLILLSQETKKEFVSLGIQEQKISVFYTFHDYHEVVVKPKQSSVTELLFMGSLDSRKGILDLLSALERLDHLNYRLHICGNVVEEQIKKEFSRKIELLKDKIVLEGYVTGAQKEKLFTMSDALVLPSYGEGMPIVIMEAMACGCSILATNVGAIPEVVKKESGQLFLPGDIDSICSAIEKRIVNKDLLECEKTYNYDYGKQFSLENNINMLANLYHEMQLDLNEHK